MDDLKAKLDALSAEAPQGEWEADGPPNNRIIWGECETRICFMAHSDGADPDGDIAVSTFITELVNAYRTGQLIVAPELTAALQEALEALGQFIYETTHLSPVETDGAHWCKISADCLATGRAALTRLRAAVAAGDLIGENDAQ